MPCHNKSATILECRSGQILLMVIVITALLVPEEDASDNPGGAVYDLEDLYNSRLPNQYLCLPLGLSRRSRGNHFVLSGASLSFYKLVAPSYDIIERQSLLKTTF